MLEGKRKEWCSSEQQQELSPERGQGSGHCVPSAGHSGSPSSPVPTEGSRAATAAPVSPAAAAGIGNWILVSSEVLQDTQGCYSHPFQMDAGDRACPETRPEAENASVALGAILIEGNIFVLPGSVSAVSPPLSAARPLLLPPPWPQCHC